MRTLGMELAPLKDSEEAQTTSTSETRGKSRARKARNSFGTLTFFFTAAYTSGRVGGVERKMHEPLTWGQDRRDGL